MTTITVFLDTSADPPVTCEPKHQSINRGNDSIEWKPGGDQSFIFSSLTGLPNPPFTDLVVTDSEITVNDNNEATGDYPYTIVVTLNGVPYSGCSKITGSGSGDPSIKNT